MCAAWQHAALALRRVCWPWLPSVAFLKSAVAFPAPQVSEYGAGSALRVLALAYRPWASDRLDVAPADEQGLVFVGLVGMQVRVQGAQLTKLAQYCCPAVVAESREQLCCHLFLPALLARVLHCA